MRISDWSSDVCSSDLLRDRDAAGRRHHRVEVARRLAIVWIALLVPAPCLDDGKVGRQPGLQDIALAADYLFLLALRPDRPDARPRVDAGDPRAARAPPPRQRALRIDRQRVGSGKSVAVRVNPWGRRMVE